MKVNTSSTGVHNFTSMPMNVCWNGPRSTKLLPGEGAKEAKRQEDSSKDEGVVSGSSHLHIVGHPRSHQSFTGVHGSVRVLRFDTNTFVVNKQLASLRRLP